MIILCFILKTKKLIIYVFDYKMNCSQHIKNILLSFFPIKTKLFLLSHSKAHQQLNSLSLEHYKIFHELQFSIDKHSNMSLYYDYYISQYPSINKQPLKEIILCRLSEYSFILSVLIL